MQRRDFITVVGAAVVIDAVSPVAGNISRLSKAPTSIGARLTMFAPRFFSVHLKVSPF